MTIDSILPNLDQVDVQISERIRELGILRALRRVLQKKLREEQQASAIANAVDQANGGDK
jgi:hypothetical protein